MGGGGGGGGGYLGGNAPPTPFPISVPLGEIRPETLDYDAEFPRAAFRPDFFAQIVFLEFGKLNWESIELEGPPGSREDRFAEIEQLAGPLMDKRRERHDEIVDQDARLVAWFAQTMMLSMAAHPNTLDVLEMADEVGLLVAIHFKNKFNRARPQQVCPAIIPMVPSPWHPSYPSGHSTESHLMALVLSEIVPNARDTLMTLAHRIAQNREIAGVHFPSDSAAGKHLAEALFPYLMRCPTFRSSLAAAKAEHAATEIRRAQPRPARAPAAKRRRRK